MIDSHSGWSVERIPGHQSQLTWSVTDEQFTLYVCWTKRVYLRQITWQAPFKFYDPFKQTQDTLILFQTITFTRFMYLPTLSPLLQHHLFVLKRWRFHQNSIFHCDTFYPFFFTFSCVLPFCFQSVDQGSSFQPFCTSASLNVLIPPWIHSFTHKFDLFLVRFYQKWYFNRCVPHLQQSFIGWNTLD